MTSKVPKMKKYGGLPVITAEKMKYLDKKASLEYGVPEDRLMENAGCAVAEETLRIAEKELGKKPGGFKITVCSGKGNNGGDGLVAARHLKTAGAEVRVFLLESGKNGYGELVARNLQRARDAGVKVDLVRDGELKGVAPELKKADLLLDALLGISAVGEPAGLVRSVIQLMNKSARPVIAVDIPSGLGPDTGRATGVFIKAAHTLTLGFAKTGLLAPGARKCTGKVKVLDIGYPAELTREAEKDI